jgi:hypothetical protein
MTNYYDTYDAAQTVYRFMYNCMFNKGSAEYAWFNDQHADGKNLSEDTNIVKLMTEFVMWGARRFF